jgi:hypothetical protein
LPVRRYLKHYKNYELKIDDLSALLPCNISRLLKVRLKEDGASYIGYSSNGVRLIFKSTLTFTKNEDDEDVVYIDYYGVPVDETTKYPLVLVDHAEACVAYCRKELYYEDYMTGKIDANRYMFLEQQWQTQLTTAEANGAGDLDEKEKMEVRKILYNIQPQIFRNPSNIY